MSKYVLDNLFGSKARVKILKFAFRNYPESFDLRILARRVQEPLAVVRREVATLRAIGLIKHK